MTILEMRTLLGLSQQKFGDSYGISLRTVQHWESGDRECPSYVLRLLERCVLEDAAKLNEE